MNVLDVELSPVLLGQPSLPVLGVALVLGLLWRFLLPPKPVGFYRLMCVGVTLTILARTHEIPQDALAVAAVPPLVTWRQGTQIFGLPGTLPMQIFGFVEMVTTQWTQGHTVATQWPVIHAVLGARYLATAGHVVCLSLRALVLVVYHTFGPGLGLVLGGAIMQVGGEAIFPMNNVAERVLLVLGTWLAALMADPWLAEATTLVALVEWGYGLLE